MARRNDIPGEVTLVTMCEDERDAFVDDAIATYATASAAAGRWPNGMAELRAAALARYDAGDRANAGECFLHIMGNGARRGTVWLVPSYDEFYILKLDIAPAYRRQGWGGAALRAVEAYARERGALVIALNVYANNAPAVSLYRSQGFDVAMQGMVKMLSGASPKVDPQLGTSPMDDATRAVFLADSSAQWADNMPN